MATKKAKNGQMLEYLIIRPTSGFNIEQIGTLILMYHADEYDYEEVNIEKDNIKNFFDNNNTWNKVMIKVKDILIEEGRSRMDYAFESITKYDDQLEKVKGYLKQINPELD